MRKRISRKERKQKKLDLLKPIYPFAPIPTVPNVIQQSIYSPVSNQGTFCAIREYFKNNPNATSVMMTCSCSLCSVVF